jgi:hypothetical protein
MGNLCCVIWMMDKATYKFTKHRENLNKKMQNQITKQNNNLKGWGVGGYNVM